MTFREDKKGTGKRKSVSNAKTPSKSNLHDGDRGARRRQPVGDVGAALRSVYDRAVKEDIPPEMLELLGKLG